MDAERIIRAYEVYLVSGKSMTWWQQQPRDAFRGYRWLKLGIDLPREQLYEKINQRVDEMFQRGLIGETRELLTQFTRNSQAFKAIGYRQAAASIEGRMTESEAIEETKEAEPALCQTATHMVSGGPLYPLAGRQAGTERDSETRPKTW